MSSSRDDGDDLELLLSKVASELPLRQPELPSPPPRRDDCHAEGALQSFLAPKELAATKDCALTSLISTPALSGATQFSSSPSCGLVSVSRPARRDDDEERNDDSSSAHKRSRVEVAVEPRTKIVVSQCTTWFDRLDNVLAEFSFCALRDLGSALRSGSSSSDVPFCTIGVVVSKSEPRLPSGGSGGVSASRGAGTGAYGVLRLWDMRGQQGFGNDRTSGSWAVFVGGSAYREHYKHVTVGSVVCLLRVQLMASSRSSSAACDSASKSSARVDFGTDGMLRCCESLDLRFLGYAANIAPCAALSKTSGERCRVLVNAGEVRYCASHVTELRKDLLSANRTTKPVVGQPVALPVPTARPAAIASSGTSVPLAPRPAGNDLGAAPASAASLRAAAAKSETFVSVRRTTVAGGGLTRSVLVGTGSVASQQRLENGSGAVATTGGVYAGVVRGPLAVTGVDRSVLTGRLGGQRPGTAENTAAPANSQPPPQAQQRKRALPQPAKLTLSEQGIGTRGREVLAAAVRQSDAAQRAAALVQCDGFPRATGDGAGAGRLSGGVTEKYFAPLAGESRWMEDVAPGALSRRAAAGASSGRVARFAADALRRQGALCPTAGGGSGGGGDDSAARSAIVLAAEKVTSRNDELRELAERDALEAASERLLKIDRALSALEKVTVQQVTAFHCAECRRWSYVKPDDCVRNGHSLQSRSVLRRFLQCHYCQHRVSVLGDTNPQLLIPQCPRCKRTAMWDVSNAAPANFSVQIARDAASEHDPERSSRQE